MKPLIKKDLIGVMHYVRDLDHASAWYCEKLGLELRGYGKNDFVELGLDGQYVMHLFKDEAAVPAARATFVFDTEDIEAAHGMLADRGVAVDPLERNGDHASFAFRDCDGNALMMSQYFDRDPLF